MRVLQIINSLATGGAEKLLLDSLPLYNKENISVDVLLLKGNDYPFVKELKDKQCCSIFSLTNGTVYNPLLLFKIIPYLKKYDVIHVHLFPAQYWVVFAKWIALSKVKLVFTEHSTSNRRMKNIFFSLFENLIYKAYDAIIAITETVRENIKNHVSLNDESIIVIQNGIDLEKIKHAEPLENFKNNFQKQNIQSILQVSSFQEPKDQLTVVKSLLYLPENFHLFLAGDGITKSKVASVVKELGLQNRVHFLGIRTDVPNLLKSVNYIVLSSKYEGLSLSSIEGMASGVPFIASKVPGLQNIVENYGILFEQGNDQELAYKILDLFKDEDLYKKTIASCLERAKHFDINLMVSKHIALYRKVYET